MIVTVVIGHYENEAFEILFMGEMSNRRAYWLLLHYLFYFHLTVSSTGVVFATSEQIAQTDLQQQSNTPTMKASCRRAEDMLEIFRKCNGWCSSEQYEHNF